MGGGLESHCVGRVYGADGALQTTTHPKTRCRKPYCNSPSNVPDDGRMYPRHVELRIHQ